MKFFVAIKMCNSLVALWLRLFTPIAGVPGSIPDQRTHGRSGGGQGWASCLVCLPDIPLPSWESYKLKQLKLFTISICK